MFKPQDDDDVMMVTEYLVCQALVLGVFTNTHLSQPCATGPPLPPPHNYPTPPHPGKQENRGSEGVK